VDCNNNTDLLGLSSIPNCTADITFPTVSVSCIPADSLGLGVLRWLFLLPLNCSGRRLRRRAPSPGQRPRIWDLRITQPTFPRAFLWCHHLISITTAAHHHERENGPHPTRSPTHRATPTAHSDGARGRGFNAHYYVPHSLTMPRHRTGRAVDIPAPNALCLLLYRPAARYQQRCQNLPSIPRFRRRRCRLRRAPPAAPSLPAVRAGVGPALRLPPQLPVQRATGLAKTWTVYYHRHYIAAPHHLPTTTTTTLHTTCRWAAHTTRSNTTTATALPAPPAYLPPGLWVLYLYAVSPTTRWTRWRARRGIRRVPPLPPNTPHLRYLRATFTCRRG